MVNAARLYPYKIFRCSHVREQARFNRSQPGLLLAARHAVRHKYRRIFRCPSDLLADRRAYANRLTPGSSHTSEWSPRTESVMSTDKISTAIQECLLDCCRSASPIARLA